MPKGKHRISSDRAKQLVKDLGKKRSESNGPFKNLPDGYIFDVNEVRALLNHSSAAHFIIHLGWKNETGNGQQQGLTPVLSIADSNYQIIPSSDPSAAGNTPQVLSATTGVAEEGGGFLDEAGQFPPPSIIW